MDVCRRKCEVGSHRFTEFVKGRGVGARVPGEGEVGQPQRPLRAGQEVLPQGDGGHAAAQERHTRVVPLLFWRLAEDVLLTTLQPSGCGAT